MRKDVKLGLAAGGVILAVLIVYGSAVSRSNKNARIAKLDTGHPTQIDREAAATTTPPPSASDTMSTPAPLQSDGLAAADNTPKTPPAAATDIVPPPAARSNVVASNTTAGGADWDKLLASSVTPPTGAQVTERSAGSGSTPAAGAAPTDVVNADPPPTATPSSFTVNPPTGTQMSALTATHAGMHTHVVKAGETLSKIAAEEYGSGRYYAQLQRANPQIDPNRLKVGMTLNVPDASTVVPSAADAQAAATSHARTHVATVADATAGPGEYKVQPNDTLYRISMKLFGSPRQVDAIYQLNEDKIGADKSKLRAGLILKLPAGAKA